MVKHLPPVNPTKILFPRNVAGADIIHTHTEARVSPGITGISGTAIAIKDLAWNDPIMGPRLAVDRHRERRIEDGQIHASKVQIEIRVRERESEREGEMEAGFRADTQCIEIDR